MQLIINSFFGTTILLDFETLPTVSLLKSKIQDKEGIPILEQTIKQSNRILNFDSIISPTDIISLSLKIQGGLKIKKIGEPIQNLDIDLDKTVEDLKQKLDRGDCIHLSFKGKKLPDDKTLESLNIKSDSILLLTIPKIKIEEKHELCINQCGFYGSKAYNYYCSKCYEEKTISAKDSLIIDELIVNTLDTRIIKITDEEMDSIDPKKIQTDLKKCWTCKKSVGLLDFKCKCNYIFCGKHYHSSAHNCTFDYHENKKLDLKKKLEKITANKL